MLKEKEKAHKQEKKEGNNPSISFLLLVLFILFCHVGAYGQVEGVDKLEEKIFHTKYSNELIEERFSRIEKLLFGKNFTGENPEIRLKRINDALLPPLKEQPNLKNEVIVSMQEDRKVIYDNSFNTGILGSTAQLEQKVFSMTFVEQPFQIRIANLEEKILSTTEIIQNRKKLLLDRIAYLLQRGGVGADSHSPLQVAPSPSYIIDPNTGYLINESTKEIVKDGSGNPIMVKMPSRGGWPSIPTDGNPLFPGGIPGQLPLDLFFNNDNNTNDSGIEDLGY